MKKIGQPFNDVKEIVNSLEGKRGGREGKKGGPRLIRTSKEGERRPKKKKKVKTAREKKRMGKGSTSISCDQKMERKRRA